MRPLSKLIYLPLFIFLSVESNIARTNNSVVANTSVFVTIVNPVSFGEVVYEDLPTQKSQRESSIVSTTENSRVRLANPQVVNGEFTTSVYRVAGAASTNYSVTLPQTITLSNGRDSVIVSSLKLKSGYNGVDANQLNPVGLTSASGDSYFHVAGVVSSSKQNLKGHFVGTVAFSVDYP